MIIRYKINVLHPDSLRLEQRPGVKINLTSKLRCLSSINQNTYQSIWTASASTCLENKNNVVQWEREVSTETCSHLAMDYFHCLPFAFDCFVVSTFFLWWRSGGEGFTKDVILLHSPFSKDCRQVNCEASIFFWIFSWTSIRFIWLLADDFSKRGLHCSNK